MSSVVRVRVVKTAGGWDGEISLPFAPGARLPEEMQTAPSGAPATGIKVKATGKTKTAAAQNAAGKALKVLNNPAVQAVLPPQVAIAAKIAKKVPFGKLKKLF